MDTVNLKSALVSVVLAVVISMGGYIIGVGDVFKLDWHALVNSGVLAGVVGIVSLAKSYGTTSSGKFLGIVQVKDPVKSEE